MTTYEQLAQSKNGVPVYIRMQSHATDHFDETPGLRQLVAKIISLTVIDKDRLYFETNMNHIVGNCNVVKNNPNDEIIYAKRRHRAAYSPFNKSQTPQPSTFVTVAINKGKIGYILTSAWVGRIAPQFPGHHLETPDSKQFWSTHSLAWGSQPIQPGTETTICPW